MMQLKFSAGLLLTSRKLLFATKLWPEQKSRKRTCVSLFVFRRELSFSQIMVIVSFFHLQHCKGEVAFWAYQGNISVFPKLRFSCQLSSNYLQSLPEKNVDKYSVVPYPIIQGNASSHGNKLSTCHIIVYCALLPTEQQDKDISGISSCCMFPGKGQVIIKAHCLAQQTGRCIVRGIGSVACR